jgi:hypothetical protein
VHAAGNWAAAEKELGTALPPDYKAIVELYGSGSFDELLWVFNPFDPGSLNLFAQLKKAAAFNDGLKKEHPDFAAALFPAPDSPAKGGLLPFAMDDEGRPFYWLTEGKPEKWTVVRVERQPGRGASFDVGTGKLLTQWLEGRVELFSVADVKHYFLPQPSGPRLRLEAVLSPSDAPFKKKVRAVRKTIETIAGPSSTVGEEDQEYNGEDHVVTAAHWLVGYSEAGGGGPKLTIDVPPEHEARMRPAIEAVAHAIGSAVETVTPAKHNRWA